MTDYVITYDLKRTNPDPHSELLKQSEKVGLKAWILASNGYWYRLPNTTLVGSFVDRATAKAAFDAAVAATALEITIPVTVEKWVLVAYSDSLFNSDVTQKQA
jgi:hypothetical protein